MKLSLHIDGYPHQIDSTDPQLLGRWVMEIFARVNWTPATLCTVQAWPSYVPDPAQPGGYRPDWLTDSRELTELHTVRTPRQLAVALLEQIEAAEALPCRG